MPYPLPHIEMAKYEVEVSVQDPGRPTASNHVLASSPYFTIAKSEEEDSSADSSNARLPLPREKEPQQLTVQ